MVLPRIELLPESGIGTPVVAEIGAHIGTHVDPLVAAEAITPSPGTLLSGSRVLGNQVLDGLSDEQRRAIDPYLAEVVLEKGNLLDVEGREISRVYFPTGALISIFAGNSNGQGIEVASIGNNGMTAPSILLEDTTSPGDTIVQMGGHAWSIAAPMLRQLADSDCHLRRYLLGRINLTLREFMDVSLSAGRLTITVRLARWLVHATQRVGSQRLIITHAALADILAVRRPSITLGLQMLEGYGLIRSTRRVIMVRNPEGLTELARLNGQGSNSRGSN
jgi:CRP-like cAMP-binding protein